MMLDELPGPEIRYQGTKIPQPVLHPGEKPPAYRILKSEERLTDGLPRGTELVEWMGYNEEEACAMAGVPPEGMFVSGEYEVDEFNVFEEMYIHDEGANLTPHPLPPTQRGELVMTPIFDDAVIAAETAYRIQECLRVARSSELGNEDFNTRLGHEIYTVVDERLILGRRPDMKNDMDADVFDTQADFGEIIMEQVMTSDFYKQQRQKYNN